MIILRDSLSPGLVKSQSQKEITLILNKVRNIKITYVSINKKNTVKVFHNTNNTLNNIPPGTLVDNEITNTENFEFFLVSQKTTQGLAQATQYTVMYDTYNVSSKDIHSLIYKLCYLYYNWTGGIKSPAPCQYAKKLAMLVGDKLTSGNNIGIPNERFVKEIRSLYFL
jgi:aubergine-like protein